MAGAKLPLREEEGQRAGHRDAIWGHGTAPRYHWDLNHTQSSAHSFLSHSFPTAFQRKVGTDRSTPLDQAQKPQALA